MVSVLPETERRALVAALKLSTTGPVAEPERISTVPVPARMASLKVTTILLLAVTLVAPSVGEKVVTVGAVVSVVGAMVALMVCVAVPPLPSEAVTTKVSLPDAAMPGV